MLQHKWFTSCLTFYEVGNIRRWELFTYSSRVHAAPGQIDYSYVQTNQYHIHFWFFNANMPCGTVLYVRQVRWVVLLWTRITVHAFIHFCRIMFDPPPLSHWARPVQMASGILPLESLFFHSLSLSSLFISETYSKWICWAGQIVTEITFGFERLLPSTLIHRFLSFSYSMLIFLQIS